MLMVVEYRQWLDAFENVMDPVNITLFKVYVGGKKVRVIFYFNYLSSFC